VSPIPRIPALALSLAVLALSVAHADDPPPPPHSAIPVTSVIGIGYGLFMDPDPHVFTKEFAVFHNTTVDTTGGGAVWRDLFHLMYQRSGGPQAAETWFGHAWSADFLHWVVDTAAFTVDTTSWNAQHVWAPSLVEHEGKVYLFYTGVDANNDQSIGYASTSLLDTSDTVWDSLRVQVWTASDTKWAVPDPPLYSFQTQMRDPFVMADPDSAGRLLLYYSAHDSIDLNLNRGGLAVGVARNRPGTLDEWEDLGYFPSTLRSVTNVLQLEGPHLFSSGGSGSDWRLMFTNAGTPPGEVGNTTIRFEQLVPGASISDTTPAHWGPPVVLKSYLHGAQAVFGWSGSEYLHVPGGDFLAGFTAWGPVRVGIAITRMTWAESDFSVGFPVVTSVDEVHSGARGVRMSLEGYTPRTRRITFALDSPAELAAKLEVFDTMGRRIASLLDGRLRKGRSSLVWEPRAAASGVYFARLTFPGGVRAAQIPIAR
jgi:hypothetical protein